jgi:hypothetical protein
MAVISVSVLESADQVVAGIPRTVAISTNVPAVIFYTLDGSDPTLNSNQYTSPIILATNSFIITLKILASNGIDSSPILTETYTSNHDRMNDIRLVRSATTAQPQENIANLYPFGNAPIQPNAQFLNPAEAGITVDNPALPEIPTGFDGAGNPVAFTNQEYNSLNYSIKYPTKDFQNKPNVGVGVFPENVIIEAKAPPPDQTDQNSNMFDPRAFVIFQDSTKENPNDPPSINRMHFTLEDPEKVRDGNNFYTSGLDAPPVSGSFVRSHYNPRTNMMTYYYFNSWNNRWIISTSPYTPNPEASNNGMAGMAMAGGSSAGARYVHEWIPFQRRVLF